MVYTHCVCRCFGMLEEGAPVPVAVYSTYTCLDHFPGSKYESSPLTLHNEKTPAGTFTGRPLTALP